MDHLKSRKAYKEWLATKREKIDSDDLQAVIKAEIQATGGAAIEVGKSIIMKLEGDKIQAKNTAGDFVDISELSSDESEALAASFITGDVKPVEKKPADSPAENPFMRDLGKPDDPLEDNPFID